MHELRLSAASRLVSVGQEHRRNHRHNTPGGGSAHHQALAEGRQPGRALQSPRSTQGRAQREVLSVSSTRVALPGCLFHAPGMKFRSCVCYSC